MMEVQHLHLDHLIELTALFQGGYYWKGISVLTHSAFLLSSKL